MEEQEDRRPRALSDLGQSFCKAELFMNQGARDAIPEGRDRLLRAPCWLRAHALMPR
jgi:hypothetical protein